MFIDNWIIVEVFANYIMIIPTVVYFMYFITINRENVTGVQVVEFEAGAYRFRYDLQSRFRRCSIIIIIIKCSIYNGLNGITLLYQSATI